MNTTETTSAPIDLLAKGYTYAAAARRVKCSTAHVYLVANGLRKSARLLAKLNALPTRRYVRRERLAH